MTEFRTSALNRSKNVEFIFRFYGVFGGLIAVLSAGYFVIKKLNIAIDSQDQLILVAFVVGVMLLFFSRVVLEYYQLIESKRAARIAVEIERYRLLGLWSRFEEAASQYLNEDTSGKPVPTRELIYGLTSVNAISRVDLEGLEQALDIRNALAHGREEFVPPELVDRATRTLEDILDVLKRGKLQQPSRARPRSKS